MLKERQKESETQRESATERERPIVYNEREAKKSVGKRRSSESRRLKIDWRQICSYEAF